MSSTNMDSNKVAKIVIAIVVVFFIGFSSFVLVKTKSGARPSKEVLVKKFLLASGLSGDDGDDAKKYFTCVVDEVHSELSDKAIDALMSVTGPDDSFQLESKFSDNDTDIMDDASSKCSDELEPEPTDEFDDEESSGDAAETSLRNAIVAVKSVQTGNGTTDFAGITSDVLNDSEPDISFVDQPLDSDSDENAVAIIELSNNRIVLQSRSESYAACYFVEMNVDSATRYGTYWITGDEACPPEPSDESGASYVEEQLDGWI